MDSQAVKLRGSWCFSCEEDVEETKPAVVLLGEGLQSHEFRSEPLKFEIVHRSGVCNDTCRSGAQRSGLGWRSTFGSHQEISHPSIAQR